MASNNTELIPQKIFKGKNADGTTFKANEWSPNSVGNLPSGEGIKIFGLIVFFMALTSPLTLLLSIFNKNSFLNFIGAVVGVYFLIDCYNGWLIFTMTMIVMTNKVMLFFIILNIASVITNLSFIIIKLITGNPILLSFVGAVIFYFSINHYGYDYLSDYDFFKYQTETPKSVYDPKPEDNLGLDGQPTTPFK